MLPGERQLAGKKRGGKDNIGGAKVSASKKRKLNEERSLAGELPSHRPLMGLLHLIDAYGK